MADGSNPTGLMSGPRRGLQFLPRRYQNLRQEDPIPLSKGSCKIYSFDPEDHY
jgi:hypothetical protein